MVKSLLLVASLFFSTSAQAGIVHGYIDGIFQQGGQNLLIGWACEVGNPSPIHVEVQVPFSSHPQILVSGYADGPSEDAVRSACGVDPNNKALNYRFYFAVDKFMSVYPGMPIIVQAENAAGVATLYNSSNVFFPGSPSSSALVSVSGTCWRIGYSASWAYEYHTTANITVSAATLEKAKNGVINACVEKGRAQSNAHVFVGVVFDNTYVYQRIRYGAYEYSAYVK